MSAMDPLAYEIRRLSTLLLRAQRAEEPGPPPQQGELAQRIATAFELRPVDVDIALATLAAELDDDFRELLHGDRVRSEQGILAALAPSLEERLRLADALGRDAPVVRKRLLRRIETNGVGHLRATRRFRAAVHGLPLLSELPPYATTIDDEPIDVPWAVMPQGLLAAMRAANHSAMCVVLGGVGVGKTSWACHAAHAVSGAALRVDAASAARSSATASIEVRELIEDAALLGRATVIDNAGELLRAETGLAVLLDELLESLPVKLFVVLGEGEYASERITNRAIGIVRVGAPPQADRRKMWRVDESADPSLRTLADDLVLTPRQIANARQLIASGASPAAAAFEQLPKMHNLTLPDRTSATLEALVLPEEVRAEIVELINAIRVRGSITNQLPSGRGRAITAMFDGDSGTGKTFACEVIAAEVGLPLMRVNVSSLVDKYIGETEKNLSRVFAQAQAQGGILFFDEADALFGTRTDVSRAQDRYANLETNLLLQLMEQFSGIVLLTTNLKQNIDQAFMRRIMFKVYFELPEPHERERLWRTVLGSDNFAPDIEFSRLAKNFELSGGSIRAALLRAAYRAEARGGKIQMSDLVECAQLETQGQGRVAVW